MTHYDFTIGGNAGKNRDVFYIPRVLILMFLVHSGFCSMNFSTSGQSSALFYGKPLLDKGDLSSLMVEGIDRFLMQETIRVKNARADLWQYDFSSSGAFNASISFQRDFLSRRLGVVDERLAPELEVLTGSRLQKLSVETEACFISAVRWSVIDGFWAEGLLMQPKGDVTARAVFIPDADVLPEVLAGLMKTGIAGEDAARRLAETGWEIIIPVMISRDADFSGSKVAERFTNQPHREWIYRQGYEVGRHVIGYELQKVFAAVDWLISRNKQEGKNTKIGVAGYGEGGLLALFAAALDQRISSTLVSGYFNAREQLWSEPIYRNVFGLLKYFGDAELAVMAWPRTLVVEYSIIPEVSGPPVIKEGRSGGAAPGKLTTPDLASVQNEFNRAKALVPVDKSHLTLVSPVGESAVPRPFSNYAIMEFARGLDIDKTGKFAGLLSPLSPGEWTDVTKRQERAVKDMERHIQRILDLCELTRDKDFWQTLSGDTAEQRPVKDAHRERFREILGSLPDPSVPADPHSRLIRKTEKWTGYEITLDVWPEVFAWGILLVPNDIRKGEKRPVIVCQHGLEGLPMHVITTDEEEEGFRHYQGFASRLADKGYVVFAPHNPYRGGDKFRLLQRKANPLGLSLFSFITGQHQRIVEWLGQQSFVDPSRIGFYGLSYGGKTAMRVPALVEGYALSVCSADFNEWVRKNASTDYPFTYMFTGEYEMPEWDLGHTFNYAEMAGLIAPRPFMVERGHYDGVGTDEWVAYEFARVRRHYNILGLNKSCRIEYFNGPHMINGIGTFEFIDEHMTGKQDIEKQGY